jgi:hypothetical protein
MTQQIEDSNKSGAGERLPRQIRLPGFISDEEVGLGDVIKRAASYFGTQACGGCEQRRVALNHWMVFTNGRNPGKGTV